PGLAAVAGPIDAALGIGAEGMAQYCRESHIGIGWMDDHAADLSFLDPDVAPRLAGVGGFVDTVAGCNVAADVGLAAADVDHVAMARGPGNAADGGDGLVVEDRFPVAPTVRGFPDPAGRRRGVIGQRIAGNATGSRHAPARRRADGTILEMLE